MMVAKQELFSKIKAAGNLPTPPEILLALLSACDAEGMDLGKIGHLIEKDPSLSLRVLQLVNSAYYGLQHSCKRIDQAVVYLGLQTIKNLAVTLSVQQVFTARSSRNSALFDSHAFWFHSLFTGTLARRIAERLGSGNSDEPYLAGLLHDIGKLLLARTFSRKWQEYVQRDHHGSNICAVESTFFGLHHPETGAWVVRQWRLSPLIGDAILSHHEALAQVAEAVPLVKILYLANLLAHENGKTELPEELLHAADRLLGLGAESLGELQDLALKEVMQLAEAMNIELPCQPGSADAVAETTTSLAADTAGLCTGENASGGGRLEEKVRDISLLTTFLEDFIKAESRDDLLAIFEEAVQLLCGVDRSMTFLPTDDERLLTAHCSCKNGFYDLCRGLSFRLSESSSLVVSSFNSNTTHIVSRSAVGENLAEQQLLSALDCPSAMIVPLLAAGKSVGVATLGLDGAEDEFLTQHGRSVHALASQLGLCLNLVELRERRAEEVQAERMAAVATAAKKFAHEVNNPLGIISNYLMTMRFKLQGNDEILEQLTIVDDEIQRIAGMVSEMDMYSQASYSRFEKLDVNEVIQGVIRLIKPSLYEKTGTVLSFVPGSNLPEINTSRDAIKQILINLLKNAVEAMGNTGRAVVRTRKVELDEQYSHGVEIIVADTGPGLSEQVLANLYQPFVSTKDGAHSGLGLSIVKKAVQQIGGRMSCVSSASQGTTFTIFIRDIRRNAVAGELL